MASAIKLTACKADSSHISHLMKHPKIGDIFMGWLPSLNVQRRSRLRPYKPLNGISQNRGYAIKGLIFWSLTASLCTLTLTASAPPPLKTPHLYGYRQTAANHLQTDLIQSLF